MKKCEVFNEMWPPYGIAFTGMASGFHLARGNGWLVAIQVLLCLFCIGVTIERIREKEND